MKIDLINAFIYALGLILMGVCIASPIAFLRGRMYQARKDNSLFEQINEIHQARQHRYWMVLPDEAKPKKETRND